MAFSATDVKEGSAVVALRPFAPVLYGEAAGKSKLVDQVRSQVDCLLTDQPLFSQVFQLPKHALTREGKDQFVFDCW